MLHLNPYWWVTKGVTVTLQFLTQDRNTQVNNSIQELPNQLTMPYNYTYTDNIDTTSFKFNDANSTETSVKLDTQIKEMANNNFGIKHHEEISPFVQALLDEEKQTNLYNNHSDSNIIDDDHVSHFRDKRSTEQRQKKDNKKLTFDVIKGDPLNLYQDFTEKPQGIKTFAAHIKMPDRTYEQLPYVGIKTLDNQPYIVGASTVQTPIPNDYLRLRLEMSSKNQPSLVFVNADGDRFVDNTKDLSEGDRNYISQIRAPNKIWHYHINTTFDLKLNGSMGSILYNSTKVANFPNTQIVFETFDNNDADQRLIVINEKNIYNQTAINPQIQVTKNKAYLVNNNFTLTDFPLKSRDILSQKFLDNQLGIQARVECRDKLYDIGQNRTVSTVQVKVPGDKIMGELPFIGFVSPKNNELKVYVTYRYHIDIEPKYQNLKLIKYGSKKYLAFCDQNGDLLRGAPGYREKILSIKDEYLDDKTHSNIKAHLSYMEAPSSIQRHPVGTKFQLGTGGGEVKVLYNHNNTEIGTLPKIVLYCDVTHTNPPTKFVYVFNLESGKQTIARETDIYAVPTGKVITLRTYKVGDEDNNINFAHIKTLKTDEGKPSGADLMSNIITKSPATPFTATESNAANASSSLNSASTTPDVPAISVTTVSTPSSTKQLDDASAHGTYSSTTEPSTMEPPTTVKIITTASTPSSTKQPETTTIATTIKQTTVTSSKLDDASSHGTYSSTTEPSTMEPPTTIKIITTASTPSSTKQPETTTIATTIKQTTVTSSKLDDASSHGTYSSTTEPSTMEPPTTVKIITTTSTPSSTKKPHSTLSTDVEYSKASTEIEIMPETVHYTTTMLPENSSISNNISTSDITNTNRTYNIDIQNNDDANQNSYSWVLPGIAIVGTATVAAGLYLFCINKKHSIIELKVYTITPDLIKLNEEECKHSLLIEKSSLLNKPQSPNKEASIAHEILNLNTISLDNKNLSRHDDCSQNNYKYTESDDVLEFLMSPTNQGHSIDVSGEEQHIYENV